MTITVDRVRKSLDFLRRRKRAYQLCFTSPAGQEVLQDLSKFCRGNQSCFHDDPRVHAALEGRREVFLRVVQHLGLTSEQLLELYSGHQVQLANGDDNA